MLEINSLIRRDCVNNQSMKQPIYKVVGYQPATPSKRKSKWKKENPAYYKLEALTPRLSLNNNDDWTHSGLSDEILIVGRDENNYVAVSDAEFAEINQIFRASTRRNRW